MSGFGLRYNAQGSVYPRATYFFISLSAAFSIAWPPDWMSCPAPFTVWHPTVPMQIKAAPASMAIMLLTTFIFLFLHGSIVRETLYVRRMFPLGKRCKLETLGAPG